MSLIMYKKSNGDLAMFDDTLPLTGSYAGRTIYAPYVTSAASAILSAKTKRGAHLCWTWFSGLYETVNGRYTDGAYTRLHVHAALTSPGSVSMSLVSRAARDLSQDPYASAGDRLSMPVIDAMTKPILAAMFRAGSSVRAYLGEASTWVLDKMATMIPLVPHMMAAGLRGLFGTSFGDTKPSPEEPNSESVWVVHVAGEILETPPGLPDNPAWDGGNNDDGGQAWREAVEDMQGQMNRIANILATLVAQGATDVTTTGRRKNFLDWLKTAVDIAGDLVGLADAGAPIADLIADAVADASGALMKQLFLQFADIFTAMTGGHDEIESKRFEKLADLFRFEGRSIAQILAEIEVTGTPDKEGWSEILDKYFLDRIGPGVTVDDENVPANMAELTGYAIVRDPDFQYGEEI